MKKILLLAFIVLSLGFDGNKGFFEPKVRIPGSSELPSSCASFEIYVKSDAPEGERLYICVNGTWELAIHGDSTPDGQLTFLGDNLIFLGDNLTYNP